MNDMMTVVDVGQGTKNITADQNCPLCRKRFVQKGVVHAPISVVGHVDVYNPQGSLVGDDGVMDPHEVRMAELVEKARFAKRDGIFEAQRVEPLPNDVCPEHRVLNNVEFGDTQVRNRADNFVLR
jgi:hypothetical protein